MITMVLNENPQFGLEGRGGPIILLARHNGQYTRPVLASAIDFRFEDNPEVPRELSRSDAQWAARHPLENLYLLHSRYLIHSRMSPAELHQLQDAGQLPNRVISDRRGWEQARRQLSTSQLLYLVPDGWWEWAIGLDTNWKFVKAPKAPREGELTPEQIDEISEPYPADLATRLDRVIRSR